MDKDQVNKLFELAKIEVGDKELDTLPRELSAILEYVRTLEKAPVDGVSPVVSIARDTHIVREDVVGDEMPRGLHQFPLSEEGYLAVHKVLKK